MLSRCGVSGRRRDRVLSMEGAHETSSSRCDQQGCYGNALGHGRFTAILMGGGLLETYRKQS